MITFDTDLSGIKPEHLSSPDFHLYACFTFYKSAYEGYTCKVEITRNNTIGAKELLKLTGFQEGETIKAVTVFQENSCGEESTKGQTMDYKLIILGYK